MDECIGVYSICVHHRKLDECVTCAHARIKQLETELIQSGDLLRRMRAALVLHVEARLEGVYIGGLQSLQPGKYALVRLKDDEL